MEQKALLETPWRPGYGVDFKKTQKLFRKAQYSAESLSRWRPQRAEQPERVEQPEQGKRAQRAEQPERAEHPLNDFYNLVRFHCGNQECSHNNLLTNYL